MQHFIGHMRQRHGVMLPAVHLALIERGQHGILFSIDGHFGRLHKGGPQVFTAALGHFTFAFPLATFHLAGIQAGGGDEGFGAVFFFWVNTVDIFCKSLINNSLGK